MTTIRFSRLHVLAMALPILAGCGGGGGGGAAPPVRHTLSVVIDDAGAPQVGRVVSSPAGIDCTATSGTCSAKFKPSDVVTLTASTTGATSVFRSWVGSCTPSGMTCTTTMSANQSVVAIFDAAGAGALGDTLALSTSGAGLYKLISFNRATPGTIATSVAVTGLGTNELVAIEYVPTAGKGVLYGLTKTGSAAGNGRLYTINESSGAATFIAPVSVTLDGAEFGMDADAVSGALKVISSTGQVLSVNPANGQAATATATGHITALAFTNGFKGTLNDAAYVIDSATDKLLTFNFAAPNPIAGVVVGDLGVDVPDANGFDIDATKGTALAAFNTTQPELYTVNLATGALSLVGRIGSVTFTETIRGLAIPTPSEPQVYAICQSANAAPPGGTAAACTPGLTLYRFQASSPAGATLIADITGMAGGETVLAMDVRPSTGELIALGSTGKLYTINTVTAAATAPVTLTGTPALDGTKQYDMDFDASSPTEQLRIVGRDAAATYNVNFNVNPTTGAGTAETALQPTPFAITALAHDSDNTNFFFFAIDSLNDRLYTLNTDQTDNPGNLVPIGPLNVDAGAVNGFDILANGTAYAALGNGTNSHLYTINLSTGAATIANATAIGATSGFSGQVAGLAGNIPQPPATQEFYTVDATTAPHLMSFNPTTPGTLTRNLTLIGLQANEKILGVDVQLDNTNSNVIYLLGSTSRLYKVNLGTGVTTQVGAGTFLTPLNGTNFGFEFDPANGNSLRIVSDTGQNMFVDSTTGLETDDVALFRDAPAIHSGAYTNNFAGAATSKFFVFDQAANQDNMMTLATPSNGNAEYVGLTLGANSDAGAPSAFDVIGGFNGLALFAHQRHAAPSAADGFSTVYAVALSDGSGGSRGAVGAASSPPQNLAERRIVVRALALKFPPQ